MAPGNSLWEKYWKEAPNGADFVIHLSRRARKTVGKLAKNDPERARHLWESFQKLYFEQNWPPANPNSSLKIRTCGKDKDGYTVYRFRGDHRHIRGYFRVIRDDEEAELPIVLVDDLTTSHDEDRSLREKVLSRSSTAEEILDVVLPVVPDVRRFEAPPGQGGSEYKQLLNVPPEELDSAIAWLESSANIIPSPKQVEAIYSPSPILINGQAGTGKTSMLAVRAAWVIAYERGKGLPVKLLCTAYSQKVVEVLRKYIDDALIYKHRQKAKADEDGSCEFLSFPEVLRRLLPEQSRARYQSSDSRVGFGRFNREFLQREKRFGRFRRLTPEFAWYVVRSLLKGLRESTPLTVDDFFSEGSTIPKKFFSEITADDLREVISLNERYTAWLRDNSYYDDLDLAFDAWNVVKNSAPQHYDEIYLDEAQDLTRVEFRVLEALLKPESTLPSKGIRIALAGDPQQTINPTGFNWTHIRALFYKGQPLRQTNFELNQRTPQPIVNLANAIQRRRREFGREETFEQRAREPFGRAPECYGLSGPADDASLKQLLRNPRPGTALLIWDEDENDVSGFMMRDPHLRAILDEHFGADRIARFESGSDPDINLDELLAHARVHTITDAKGLEFERVIFYKVGSHPSFAEFAGETVGQSSVKGGIKSNIAVLYHLNRLYIGVTRPTKCLFLFDEPAAVDGIWDRFDEIDSSRRGELHTLNSDPALAVEDERNWVVDAKRYLDSYREDRDPRMLAHAMECLDRAPHHAEAQLLRTEVQAEQQEEIARSTGRASERDRAKRAWAQAGSHWSQLAGRDIRAAHCFIQAEEWAEARRHLSLLASRSIEHEGWLAYSEMMSSQTEPDREAALRYLGFLLDRSTVPTIRGSKEELSRQLQRLGLAEELIRLHEEVLWSKSREDIGPINSLCDFLVRVRRFDLCARVIERNRLERHLPRQYSQSKTALATAASQSGDLEGAGKQWRTLADSGAEDDEAPRRYRNAAEAFAEAAVRGLQHCWRDASECYAKSDQPNGLNESICRAEDAARVGNYSIAVRELSGAIPVSGSASGPLKQVYTEARCWAQLENWTHRIDYAELARAPDVLSSVIQVQLQQARRESAKGLLARVAGSREADSRPLALRLLTQLELEDGNFDSAISYFERAEEYGSAWRIVLENRANISPNVARRAEGLYLARQYEIGEINDRASVERALSLLREEGLIAQAERLDKLRIDSEKDLVEKVRLILVRGEGVEPLIAAITAVNASGRDPSLETARLEVFRRLLRTSEVTEPAIVNLRSALSSWMRDVGFVMTAQPEFSEQEWGLLVEYSQDDLSAKAYYQVRAESMGWARDGVRRTLGRMRDGFRLQARADPTKQPFVQSIEQELDELEDHWKTGTPVSLKRSDAEVALMRQKLERESVAELRERWRSSGIPGSKAATKEVLVEGYLEYWSGAD